MEQENNELIRNGSGYYDPTAYEAIKRVEDRDRFKKLLGCILRICELAGFSVEGRIVLKDERTGKIWK